MHLKQYFKEWVENRPKGAPPVSPIGPLHGAGVLDGEQIGIRVEREKVLADLRRLQRLAREKGGMKIEAGEHWLGLAIKVIEDGDHAPWGRLDP